MNTERIQKLHNGVDLATLITTMTTLASVTNSLSPANREFGVELGVISVLFGFLTLKLNSMLINEISNNDETNNN